MTLEFIRNALTIFQQFCCHIFILLHLIFVVADRFLSEFFCCSRRQWNPVGIPLTKSASFAFRWIGSVRGIQFVGYTKLGYSWVMTSKPVEVRVQITELHYVG